MSDKEWFSGRAVDDPEARAERHELRKVFGILAIVGMLVGLFLGLSGCAVAPAARIEDEPKAERSLVFRGVHPDGSPVALRIFTARQCEHAEVLAYLKYKYGAPPELLSKFKAATLTYGGRDWASCWIEQQGQVVSVDEEGAPFRPVPRRAMREEGT